ncbi:MAG: leucine-rich repeat domain-containing protein [Prevotella sp.]|nr:leucine-rich repeat domain-containing protein [Prevotella sp.]
MTSVTIGSSVTSIGWSAFEGCSGLTKVIVPDIAAWCNISFGSYDANPLYYAKHIYSDENTEIKDLVIPNSVTRIGSSAFYKCSGLTSVTIGNSVTRIGDYAFESCSSLTSVTIGNSVTTIGESAFGDCSGLTSITIPNSVKSLGGSAFSGCSGLASVTIPNSVTSIDWGAFYGCSGLKSITIPNSVTTIDDHAFYNCSNLTSVTIPNSVTSIGNEAFYGCSSLKEITSYIQEPFQTGDYCWGDVDKSIPLYVPAGSKEKYQSTGGWKDFTNIIEKPAEPTGISSVDNSQSATGNEADDWYTIDGRKLSGKPAQKGIYIVNGRKVAVK